MEPRAKTLIERFGFKDPELSTPRHDEIMLWLDENAESVMQEMFGSWSKQQLERFTSREITERRPPKIRSKTWEFPISDGKFVVGFVDMRLVAFLHVAEEGGATFTQTHNILFEVKPAIPSVGQLIRQIQMYRKYTDDISSLGYLENSVFVVVSPDDRFASVLRSQRIAFLKCP